MHGHSFCWTLVLMQMELFLLVSAFKTLNPTLLSSNDDLRTENLLMFSPRLDLLEFSIAWPIYVSYGGNTRFPPQGEFPSGQINMTSVGSLTSVMTSVPGINRHPQQYCIDIVIVVSVCRNETQLTWLVTHLYSVQFSAGHSSIMDEGAGWLKLRYLF